LFQGERALNNIKGTKEVQAKHQFSLYKARQIVKHLNLKVPFEFSDIYATRIAVFKQYNVIVHLL